MRFGRLTVLREGSYVYGRAPYWLCRCDCATEKEFSGNDLQKGKSKSCRCLANELTRERATTHGGSKSRLYRTWCGMLKRCDVPSEKSYKNYGGRGITVCKSWRDFSVFQKWALSHGYADHLTIERRDNDDDYKPSNCTWITKARQTLNTRLVPKSPDGEAWIEIARKNGVTHWRYRQRRTYGWPPEIAATAPKHFQYRKKESLGRWYRPIK